MQFVTGPQRNVPRGIALIRLTSENQSRVRESGNRTVIELGAGPQESRTRRTFILRMREAISLAKTNRTTEIAISFSDWLSHSLALTPEEIARLLGHQFEIANFEFVKYKSKPKEGWPFVKKVFVIASPKETAPLSRELRKGRLVGEEVNKCRALANAPAGEMTPKLLAEATRAAAQGTPVNVRVLGREEMKELGMGGVLGVAQGSSEEPQFIILEYFAGDEKEKPLVLVGKGVTFDTGGLNLKPSEYITDMHLDMSGGAAVIHTITLAARLGLKRNVIGLIPAAENMPSGSSYRPGDILRSMSGITIEITNTDAEGRVILADALTYAQRYRPKLVIDVATLTSAASVALGSHASAIFTKDEKLEKLIREAGERSGDYVWGLPLWSEYEEEIKGTFGDIANAQKSRYGGAIHGAAFLY